MSAAIYVWVIEKFPTDVHSPVWDSEGSAFYEVQRMARSLRDDSNLTLRLVHDLLMYDRRRDFGTSKAVVDSDGFIWAYVRRTTRRRSCTACNRPHFSGGLCAAHRQQKLKEMATPVRPVSLSANAAIIESAKALDICYGEDK